VATRNPGSASSFDSGQRLRPGGVADVFAYYGSSGSYESSGDWKDG